MMDISDLIGLGTSVASGGLFGLLGSIVGVGSKWLQRREARQQAKEVHEMDMQRIRLEMESKSQQGSWSGLVSSQLSETKINEQPTYRWVVAMKSLFRPFLTTLLWAISTILFFNVMNGSLSHLLKMGEIESLIRYMIYSTFFCATTATTWWFGDRALNPPELKNR